ncbi:hypothetical protein PMAYCL1PPCAC_01039, partial [Pristionchus mayeri]
KMRNESSLASEAYGASRSSSLIFSLASSIALICCRPFGWVFLFLPSRLQLFFFFLGPLVLCCFVLYCEEGGERGD